ncbi:PREDICTED: uncharacterized protein LOC105361711 [Ceratosolen solmsi marchali]|uniref:Uncharacterized protein LOC105361711 n=1 Tax=Ceratosolen solmsi marchali TaxID=326594 RepID=A0AAJ7DUV4_9HYME|nr:PREDICTED: uncharacterized protein LOC105361711 [Ceratosolen solmsi marchali]
MVLSIWWFLFGLSYVTIGNSIQLVAYISSGGLHGEIRFEPTNNGIRICLALKPTLQYPDQHWLWFIKEFPVDYTTLENRCDNKYLGKSIIDLTKLVGPLEFPGNETTSIEMTKLNLASEKDLWGKGLLLKDTYSERITCASITVLDKNIEQVAEARFHGSIVGSVWLRWIGIESAKYTMDTIIYTYLLYLNDKKSQDAYLTEHRWKIYATDIFDSGKERISCNSLQTVFDPDNAGFGKSIGDIDTRLGKLNISSRSSMIFRSSYRDPELVLRSVDLESSRILYLVIFHPTHEDLFLACAKIKLRKSIIVKSIVNFRGIKGDVSLVQENPFNPTWVNISLMPINDLETRLRYETKVASYRIHELPIEPDKLIQETIDPCLTTKNVYDPLKIYDKEIPPAGYGTQDQYAVGDLSGKLQGHKEGSHHFDILPSSAKLSGIYWDTYLPLSGINSVVHRSLVVYKYNEINDKISIIPWVCGTFAVQLPENAGQMPMNTAEVIFRYPIVGKIIFRQPRNEPEMDTTIIIENLIHTDGSILNDSFDHRWMIHDNPPGRDYYNWTARCMSTGAPFNPYKVQWDSNHIHQCSVSDMTLCRIGDFFRHGTINIAGRKINGLRLTRKLFSDPLIKLSGSMSIIGKSLVIYDDRESNVRGERLACSIITRMHRQKAVAKDWFSNEENITINGNLKFIQESPYDITNIKINLEDLNINMGGFHIHMTPVEIDLEFPCESTSLYGQWNPLNVNASMTPPPATGTSDQYAMGDLSGKFGILNIHQRFIASFKDTQLPLFGLWSILGRSVVIYKKEKNTRLTCTTIEREYAPLEAKELKAIASFHHPYGFAYGYIRMKQLIYNDGSQSDTIIEVNLRHPGKYNRNVTRNHNWAIYINPIGIDASIKTKDTRCIAGGYRWNPYFTQLSDPLNQNLYMQECGPDIPLRCDVGDISARLGPIDIGLERKVFVDQNFPLGGSITAVGKSIIILDSNFSSNKFACANIELDNDIVKYAIISKSSRFVAAQFLEEIRQIMGVPEWMLSIDSRKTKILHNSSCIQFLMHFKGPIANKLEQDFSKLMYTGKLEAPSLTTPGYVQFKHKNIVGYRHCGIRNLIEKSADILTICVF